MKILFFLFCLLIFSCKEQIDETNIQTDIIDCLKTETKVVENETSPKNRIEVDFEKNKVLLDIILQLPDEAFSSWEWSFEDRTKWYNEIKTNNSYIDNNPNYFTQKYFEPTKAKFFIVDDSWLISIYKTIENSYIVITNDIVGGGNSIEVFEYKSNKLKKYLNEKLLFDNYIDKLKEDSNQVDCTESHEELLGPIFNFNFLDNTKIEIESSWYLSQDEYSNCLKGNTLIYNFNPKTKKFDLEKLFWKPKSEE